jgi:disulfide bond formation protein DsbB
MLTTAPPRPEAQDAYKSGAATLVVALAVILAALGFEHIGGHLPCPLCLQQRYAYYAGVPLLFLALVLLSAEQHRLAGLLFLAVALGFLVNAGLGVYQAGAEWKYWPGPESCAGAQSISTTAGGLLKDLANTKVIRCDEASWRFLGLSFAGWNAVLSLLLFVSAMRAAFSATARD